MSDQDGSTPNGKPVTDDENIEDAEDTAKSAEGKSAKGSGADAQETLTPTKKDSLFHRLYVGTGAFDIVGKRKRWYVFFSVLMLVCIGTALFKGFNFGLEFTGGTQISMPTQSAQGELSEERVREVFNEASPVDAAQVQTVGTGGSASVQIRSDHLTPEQTNQVQATLFQELQPLGNNGQPSQQAISDSAVSGTWGGEISRQALIALAVFFVLVSVFLALYFEKWMAVAAMITVVHDVVLTAGVYAIVGLEVTPASVIGLLTILGYSLYDTVVVFDKVKENTRGILGLTRRTYAEAANLAVNQTLARSINTTVIALLPVVALLAIGVGLLGVGTLQDLAVVQAVGVFAGTVSSVLLATPLLVDFKMRGQDYKDQARKVQERRDRVARKASGEPAATAEDMDWSDEESHDKELRKEKAAAAAASVPTRAQSSRSSRSTSGGQKATKPSASGRPTGKASRPTGKKRR